jgi:putative tryptophan/tyrosine transport system permease protein
MKLFWALIDNALLQGLTYGVAVLGIAIAFRVIRYPDLTADGSFVIGAAGFGALLNANCAWPIAAGAAMLIGALAGLTTALLHSKVRINRLLTGILTSMICYSLAFRVLSGKSNISLQEAPTIFSWAASFDAQITPDEVDFHPATVLVSTMIAMAMAVLLYILLRSEFGVVLRASGQNQSLVEEMGRRPLRYYAAGLALANGLVGLAGGLVASRQGFVDVNMGMGIIIVLVAALVIGEDLLRLIGFARPTSIASRITAPILGCCVYYFLYLVMLRASINEWVPFKIQPTDLKFLSALIVIVVIALRVRGSKQQPNGEEILPL